MRDLGLEVGVDEIGNVVGTRAGHRAGAAAGDDRLAHRHRAHRRPLRRQPRRAGRPRGGRDARTRAASSTRRPLAVAFFTNEEGARFQPDMLGSLVYVGGLPLEEALDIGGHRRRPPSATSWRASATPGRCRARRRAPARVRRAAHRAGPGARGARRHDRRGHRRAGHLVAGARRSSASRTTPARRRWRCATTPATSPPRSSTFVRRLADELGRRTRSARSGASSSQPDLVNVVAGRATLTVDLRNTDDGVLAGGRAPRCASVLRELAERPRASTITSRVAGPLRAGDVRPDASSTSSSDGASGSATRRCAHAVGRRPRRADAGPACARRAWCSRRASAASATTRPSTPTPTTSRPARTCCCNVLLALADALGRRRGAAREPRRHRRRRPDGPVAARRHSQARSSSGCSRCCTRRTTRAASSSSSPSWRSRRSSPAGSSTTRPSSTRGSRREMPSADTQAAVRRGGRASASASASGFAELTPERATDYNTRSSSSPTAARSARYRKVHLPGHEEHEPWRAVPAPRALLLRARPRRLRRVAGLRRASSGW